MKERGKPVLKSSDPCLAGGESTVFNLFLQTQHLLITVIAVRTLLCDGKAQGLNPHIDAGRVLLAPETLTGSDVKPD